MDFFLVIQALTFGRTVAFFLVLVPNLYFVQSYNIYIILSRVLMFLRSTIIAAGGVPHYNDVPEQTLKSDNQMPRLLNEECPVCFYPTQESDMVKLQCCGKHLCKMCDSLLVSLPSDNKDPPFKTISDQQDRCIFGVFCSDKERRQLMYVRKDEGVSPVN